MNKIREFLNSNPWLGWAVAAVLLIAGIVVYVRMSGGSNPYSRERMSEIVTIKCIETGDEWEMTRGMMEKTLRNRGKVLDPTKGLPNPNTGRLTGFPFDKGEWEETIKRINREKQEILASKDSDG